MITIILSALLAGGTPAPAPPCSDCHRDQAAAWQSSLHAMSLDDPLYSGMRAWASDEAGETVAAGCATCHSAPLADGSGRTAGVTCAVCHQATRTGPGPGGLAVDPSSPIQADTEAAPDAPHPVAADRALAAGRICLACHAELHNPAGVPLCTTGPENEAWTGTGSCLSCHMPDGSHAFPGASPELLRRAATVTVAAGPETVVKISNTGAGHAIPTGPVLRQVVLEVRFLDRTGAQVGDVSTRVLARVLGDDDGHAPVPPWRATRVVRDTRLSPGETRAFSFPTPAGAASSVARLVYRRAPPAIAQRLGVADLPLLRPYEMARAEATIAGRPDGPPPNPRP